MHNIVEKAKSFGYKQNMAVPEKKSEQVLINITPAVFRQLAAVAAREDRPTGYVARELMLRGLKLYAADGNLRESDSITNIVHNALQRAIPPQAPAAVAEFDLETEIRDGLPPDVIMSKWLIYEGKEPPQDYGLLMFGGWETMTPEERTDALRDAKKVLDRNFQRSGADVKPFPVAADAPLRREIQRQIDEVPLKPPKAKRRTKK